MAGDGVSAKSFQGVLFPTDSATFITYPFKVTEGCSIIRLRLSYAPYHAGDIRNLVTLGLFDPHGFRGQAHRGPPDAEIIVSDAAATPGFIAGPLPAGQWFATLAVCAIVPGYSPCTYTLDIGVSRSAPADQTNGDHALPLSPDLPVQPARDTRPGPRWYRGELHSHTVHSDGACSVAGLLSHARRRNLYFVALTDHNTISAWKDNAAACAPDLLVIPGMELTTFRGHAVALGVDRWIDWRTGYNGWTINDAARATHDAGGLFITAHPWSIGSPTCAGCRWDYTEMDMELVDGIEVWSGRWDDPEKHNPLNVRMWRQAQAAPHPPVAVAAADFHSPPNWGADVPITYVYAQDLSTPSVLDGIRQGRITLTTGPWIELRQTTTGVPLAECAASVPVAGRTQTSLEARWRHAPVGARLRWLVGDALLGDLGIGEQGVATLAAPPDRVHVEMWSGDDCLLAMTNPVAISP